jgi:hypothetical protein
VKYIGFLGYALGALTAGAAAVYVIVYLYRWEWQRALLSGVLLLVIEVFLATAAVLGRVARLERRLTERDARAEEVLRRTAASPARSPTPTPSPSPDAVGPFRWLGGADSRGGGSTFVFVPVLVAAGAVLSVAAVVIQRLAAATVRPGAERRLAGRLDSLAAPPGGILGGGPRLAEEPPVPPARPLRLLALGVAALAAALLVAAAVEAISDATQTRPQAAPDSAASTIVFRVEIRDAARDAAALAHAADELWSNCRRSMSTLPEGHALTRLRGQVYAGVLRPALSGHDMWRLRGCLSDATADRALATVLGEGQASPGAPDR